MGAIASRDVDLAALPGVLEAVARSAEPKQLDFTKSMKESSVYMAGQAKERFAQSRSPDGTPFKPLKRPRNRKRDKRAKGGTGQKPLWNTGVMGASMQGTGRGSLRDIGRFHMEQGSNLDRAGWHNFGTRTIPPRPFAGITDKNAERIEQFIGDDAARQLAG